MKQLAGVRGRIVTPGGIVAGGVVRFEGEWISSIEPGGPAPGVQDVGDALVYPGWINIHVHGGMGADFADSGVESPRIVAEHLVRQGYAGFLATYVSMQEVDQLLVLKNLRECLVSGGDAIACALGVHFEGPFLSPGKKGAHIPQNLASPSVPHLERLLDAVPAGLKTLLTLAPELDGADQLIAVARARPYVITAAGHTAATYARCQQAIAGGVRHAVHLFNAMAPLHHREPGAVGAYLTAPGTTVEVIPDRIHLHPGILKLVSQAKGAEGIIAVTDAIAPAGLGDGTFDWAGQSVTVTQGRACLADGTLAGSVLETTRMVEILQEDMGFGPMELAQVLSANPARLLADETRGRIAVGCRADLTVIDARGAPVLVVAGGRLRGCN